MAKTQRIKIEVSRANQPTHDFYTQSDDPNFQFDPALRYLRWTNGFGELSERVFAVDESIRLTYLKDGND